ncbi:MAG: Polysaccharide deacetylase [Pseudolabrys sp.]|jgi:peptidoglycan/xylan/chitin deacetylase (PgdA/CDA1 family)|nr:Polysaccharide deacetylase [Pseudolabrys sp.]
MRNTFSLALVVSAMLMTGAAFAQTAPAPADAAKPAAEAQKAPATAVTTASTCANPNALGVSRVVQIDTTGGPGFGFEHFKAYDFLQDHEVVLTFDDGPWPGNTPAVLKALADQCTKGLFFPIGKHAGWHPEILKEVAKAGQTIGSHTWSHKDLTKLSDDEAKAEIEKGIAAVSVALGNKPVAPFIRFPALRHPPEMLKYVGSRNIAVFSTDIDSFDFKMRHPQQVVKSVMTKLEKRGKGIILMHDFQHATAEALPEILKELKAGGYKVVQITGKTPVEPLPEYKEMVLKEMGGGLDEARPMSSVVKTISN